MIRAILPALLALSFRAAADVATELTLLLSLGDAYSGAGDTPKAKDAYLRAAVAARESDAAESLATAALGYGGPLVWARPAGDRLVVPLLEEALAACDEIPASMRA